MPIDITLFRPRSKLRRWSGAFALAALLTTTGTAIGADLRVEITDVSNANGSVLVNLCDKARFMKDCTFGQRLPAPRGSVMVVFANLVPGKYAVQAFHDENGNGKLDTDAAGIPTEGVGFSRNAAGNFGPPTFESAALDVGAADMTIKFRMAY